MKTVFSMLSISAAVVVSFATSAMASHYSDNFTSNTSANYAVDRTNPGGFTVGTGHLEINVLAADLPGQESSFFNFHGIGTNVGDFDLGATASLSVDLLVPSSWNAPTARRGGDLWARINDTTTSDPGLDYYPTIGVYNYADGGGAHVSMYSPTAGGFDGNPATDDEFLDLDPAVVPIHFGDYNGLRMDLTPGGLKYYFNNVLVATDNDPGYQLPGSNLEQALLEGWQGDVDYAADFEKLRVVPEPTTLAAVVGAGTLGLRRRRRA